MMYIEDDIQMQTIFGDGSQQGGLMSTLLGAGKRLLCGFGESLDLEYLHVRQAPCDTHITDRLIR